MWHQKKKSDLQKQEESGGDVGWEKWGDVGKRVQPVSYRMNKV